MAAGAVLRSFAIPSGATGSGGLDYDGRSLWYLDTGSTLVYELDPRQGNVLRSWGTGITVPVAVALEGNYVYILSGSGAFILYRFTRNGKLVWQSQSIAAIDSPRGIILAGRRLYTLQSGVSIRMLVLDRHTLAILRTLASPVSGGNLFDIRLSHEGTVYGSDATNNNIAVFDLERGILKRTIPAPSGSTAVAGLALYPGLPCIWIACRATNLIYVISLN